MGFALSTATAATDVCTSSGHGLTLAQKLRLVATANLSQTLPGGTTEGTDYFAIPIDANTYKIATSSANAIAGTAVNITADSAGFFAVFGLPYVRPITYAALSQLRSQDLNAIFDAITALWNVQQTDTILGVDFVSTTGTNVTYDVNSGRAQTTGATTLIARLPLRTSDRLKSIRIFITGDGAVDVTSIEVWEQSNTSRNLIGSSSSSNVSSTTVAIDVTDTQLIASSGSAGDAIYVLLIVNATGLNLYNVTYTYDRPIIT